MKKIDSQVIDTIIERLEGFDDEKYEQQMEVFAEEQPVLFSYLFSEQFELLSEEEQGYLQYLALIAWLAIKEASGGNLEAVSEEQIGEAEEKNYELLENAQGQSFADRLNVFFDDEYAQADLLDYAADAVLEEEGEEDAIVTDEGREPIFIALKTMIDVLAM